MKKNLIIMGVLLFGFFLFVENTEAACGSGVEVGSEQLCLISGSTDSNSGGTAYVKSSKLVLNNYNGGSIKFYSGLGNPITGSEIELIGDNYITNETGYGILSFVTGINFVGDGTLTIKSKLPFVSTDADRQAATYFFDNNEVTTIKIVVGENSNPEIPLSDNENIEVTPEEEKQENEIIDENIEKSKVENNNLMIIALFASSCISVVCLIIILVLILKNNKLKKINN